MKSQGKKWLEERSKSSQIAKGEKEAKSMKN
jgi:hypothetical protein